VRTLLACLVLCFAAARGHTCPIVEEGRWPWLPYFVLSGARYDPEHEGAVALPPQPRLFVFRRFNDTVLPAFHTPSGETIHARVTACDRFVVVDLDIDSGTVIVDDVARGGDTKTFIVRRGLPAATRYVKLVVDGYGARLEHDSDAVAFRIDHADGTQSIQFNGHLHLPAQWRGARVVALYADRTEEVIYGQRPRLPRYQLVVLGFALLGVVWLVTRDLGRGREFTTNR
jgi:hypothetical protein